MAPLSSSIQENSINHVLSTHLTHIIILCYYHTFTSQLQLHLFEMSKLFTLLTLLSLIHHLSPVLAQVPSIPSIWDPSYPLNRCIDFCAFLRPGQICPAERNNPNCLCAVYNIRLPAVYPSKGKSDGSVRNVGGRRM